MREGLGNVVDSAGLKLKRLVKTCTACPAQWEGESKLGHPVYIRYRWGHLTVSMGGKWGGDGTCLYNGYVGHAFDGTMTTWRMAELTGVVLPDTVEYSDPGMWRYDQTEPLKEDE